MRERQFSSEFFHLICKAEISLPLNHGALMISCFTKAFLSWILAMAASRQESRGNEICRSIDWHADDI